MSYRKITVEGKKYEYIIGKTHTKVKGVGVVNNVNIASYHWKYVNPCGKGCDCDSFEKYLQLRVTPKDVAMYIINALKKISFEKTPMHVPPEGYVINETYPV